MKPHTWPQPWIHSATSILDQGGSSGDWQINQKPGKLRGALRRREKETGRKDDKTGGNMLVGKVGKVREESKSF